MGDIGVESRPNMILETTQAAFPIKINMMLNTTSGKINQYNDKSMYQNKYLDTTVNTSTA